MKVCFVTIYIPVQISESEEINKDSMFKWIFFAIQKLSITCMIGFYVHKSFLLYIGFLETVQINNQKIFHVVSLWTK